MNLRLRLALLGIALVVAVLYTARFYSHWNPQDPASKPIPLAERSTRPAPNQSSGATKIATLTGEAAKAELRKNGQFESLGKALTAARHAIDKIDPSGPHSRGAEYFAANPRQQLRAWFSKDGVELASGIPTAEDTEPWSLKLRVHRWGRAGSLREVSSGDIQATGQRVEMVSSDRAITQWFENRREGIEHGFTIVHRPPGEGVLRISLEISGSLRGERLQSNPEELSPTQTTWLQTGLRFVDPDSSDVLHYTGLKAWDSTGRSLAAKIRLHGSHMELVVADGAATGPIHIDPMFANVETRLLPNSVAGDEFGTSVAVSNDTALVGAPLADTAAGADAGRAYVFQREGTNWSLASRLEAADGQIEDRFGKSVAISEDTALIGAPYADSSENTTAGAAYVFVWEGGEWREATKLTADDSGPFELGYAVALHGERALLGARAAAGGSRAYVFGRSGATWTEEAQLAPSDGATGDWFGTGLALSNDRAIVGARRADTPAGEWAGSAYVFVRSGTDWREEAKLIADDGAQYDSFGTSVALTEETAVVGSPGSDNRGAVYVFTRNEGSWQQADRLITDETSDYARLGTSVAASGSHVLAGAPDDRANAGLTGSAHLFQRIGNSWNQVTALTATDGRADDRFGRSVALSDETALVGAPLDTTPAGVKAGSAYLFSPGDTSWTEDVKLSANDGRSAGSLFGASVALWGNTALVGAPEADSPAGADSGSAYVLARSASGWNEQAKLTADSPKPYTYFGRSVALVEDTALVGEPQSQAWIGSAHVFRRSGGVWTKETELTASDGDRNDFFGSSVSLSENRALIGTRTTDRVPGAAYVFERKATRWVEEAKLTADDGTGEEIFGWSVALSTSTALVGSPSNSIEPGQNHGSAYILVQDGEGWNQEAKLAERVSTDGNFGEAVGISGDTALVGAPFANTAAGFSVGVVYVYERDGSTWTEEARLSAADGSTGELFGRGVALSGNTALVGTPCADIAAGRDAGAAYVFVRDSSVWRQQLKLTSGLDASSHDQFGWAVCLDGNKAIVGAGNDDTDGLNSGSAYLFLLGELPEISTQPVSRTVIVGDSVSFTVAATGYLPLTYQWRKDGEFLSGATANRYSIPSARLQDQGNYDCVVSNTGGVVTSAAAILSVNNLSQFEQEFPASPPGSEASALVFVTNGDIGAAWRYVGEREWRAPGIAAGGLTTSDRSIEFRPLPGYTTPDPIELRLVSGGATAFKQVTYEGTGESATASLQVQLRSVDLANQEVVSELPRWRLHRPGQSETSNPWLQSGGTVTGLVPGDYEVEFHWVEGWVQPQTESLAAAEAPGSYLATYRQAPPGEAPAPIPIETVWNSPDFPYAYAGQIRSVTLDQNNSEVLRLGSGFVVKDRVVATAAHVVFDSTTLSARPNIDWLLQRDRNDHEPVPMIPRGYAVLAGYDSLWTDGSDGQTSTADQQELDVAALWFFEPAGRGGFSGFLASNRVQGNSSDGNEWLLEPSNKILLGYPVEGVPSSQAGRLHATAPRDLAFQPAGRSHTYKTTDFQALGGNSGGPLCVQFEGGNYYPAAILLGGSGQAVVRAFDGEVVELFNTAEFESNGGDNVVSGGVTTTVYEDRNSGSATGALQVDFNPPLIRTADPEDGRAAAKWRFSDENAFALGHGAIQGSLDPAVPVTIHFKKLDGFLQPAPAIDQVIVSRKLLVLTCRYEEDLNTLGGWRHKHFGTTKNEGDAADDADPDGDGRTNSKEFLAGTDPNTVDSLSARSAAWTAEGFTLTIEGRKGRIYQLQRSPDLQTDSWSTVLSTHPLADDADVALTDPSPPPEAGYYRVLVTMPPAP